MKQLLQIPGLVLSHEVRLCSVFPATLLLTPCTGYAITRPTQLPGAQREHTGTLLPLCRCYRRARASQQLCYALNISIDLVASEHCQCLYPTLHLHSHKWVYQEHMRGSRKLELGTPFASVAKTALQRHKGFCSSKQLFQVQSANPTV